MSHAKSLYLCIILSLFVSIFSYATNYYVDGANGDDGDNGLTIGTAFKTIKKAADTISTSDDVYIRGGTYYQEQNVTLRIKTGGTSNDPMVYQPYNNEEVIIIPGRTYSGWSQDTNGVYYKQINGFDLVSGSGRLMKKDGFIISEVNGYDYLVNPNIIVQDADPNDFDLFYYDTSTNTIYVRLLAGGDPDTDVYVISSSNEQVVIDHNAEYVEIKDLIFKYGFNGIKTYSDHTNIVNCDFKHISDCGILSIYYNYLSIKDNSFEYSGRMLEHNDSDPNQLVMSDHKRPVYVKTSYSTIAGNAMTNCQCGAIITVSEGSDNEVYNNYFGGRFFSAYMTNLKLYNNVIVNSNYVDAWGIKLYHTSGLEIYNNLIIAQNGFVADVDINALMFKNNIVCADSYIMHFYDPNTLLSADIDYNCYHGGTYFATGLVANGNRTIYYGFDDYQDYMTDPNNNFCHETNSFSGDPFFIDGENGDYHLSVNSPCIDAGDPCSPSDPNKYDPYGTDEVDYDGVPRVLDGDNNGSNIVDIGPYEYKANAVYNANQDEWFETINGAIDGANEGETVVVYPGTYYEKIDFDGKTVTLRSVDPNDWDIVEATVIDANDTGRVVTFENSEDADSVLSGLTITGGYATGSGTDDSGAGIYCYNTSPTIQNCLIKDNYATQYGGGIYTAYGSPQVGNCLFTENEAYDSGGGFRAYSGSPVVTDCNFVDNTAWYGAAIQQAEVTSIITDCTFINNQTSRSNGYGGAIRNLDASPVITGCTFLQNSAYNGGAISNSGDAPEFFDCVFSQNSSSNNGGAVINQSSCTAVFDVCIFDNNLTTYNGGAIRNENSAITLRNSLLISNEAASGGAVYNNNSDVIISNCTFSINTVSGTGGALRNYNDSDPTITNCIFWGDSATSGNEISNAAGSDVPVVTYSDVAGGYSGTGNINTNPLFADDFHLASNSECIDAGNNSAVSAGDTDIDGDDRIIDGDGDQTATVDMGADEAD